jgi:cytochrome c oxidase subunit 2
MVKNSRKYAIVSLVIALLMSGFAVFGAAAEPPEQVIKITAKKFEYSPSEITVKKGVPVTLELESLDRLHGFNSTDLGIRTDIKPNQVNRVHFVPQKPGTYEFHCDVFCGEGHGEMTGKIIVIE